MNRTARPQCTFFNRKINALEPIFQTPRNTFHSIKQLNFAKENKPLIKNEIYPIKTNLSRTSSGFYPSKKVNINIHVNRPSHSISTPKSRLKIKVNSIIKEFSTSASNKTNIYNSKSNPTNSMFKNHLQLSLKLTPIKLKIPKNTQKPLFSQEETIKEMRDKYISSISDTSLKKDDSIRGINKKNFRKLLMRDFCILRGNECRSKQLYNMENDLLLNLDEIQYNSKNLNKLCHLHLDNYYKNRLKKTVKNSKRIANEIKEMICPAYEEIIVPIRSSSSGGKINYLNLERKIKVFHIEKFNYDVDNDDLGFKNLTKLKKKLQKMSINSMKCNSKVLPKFVKGKVKDKTVKKYRSLFGMFFGLSE